MCHEVSVLGTWDSAKSFLYQLRNEYQIKPISIFIDTTVPRYPYFYAEVFLELLIRKTYKQADRTTKMIENSAKSCDP